MCHYKTVTYVSGIHKKIAHNVLLTRRRAAFCAMCRRPSEVLRAQWVSFVIGCCVFVSHPVFYFYSFYSLEFLYIVCNKN
jgi:hypothetical protein